jgi:membrane protease YdiL (CAAX protease family)
MNPKYHFMPDVNTGCLSDEDTKKYISRAATAIIAFEVISYFAARLIATIVVTIVNGIAPDLINSVDFIAIADNMIGIVAIYVIATPAFLMTISPLPKVAPFKEKLSAGAFVGGLCVCFFAMMLGNSFSSYIIAFISGIGGSDLTNPVEEMIGQANSMWIDIVFVAILVPILEELFFRKLLCDRLLPLGEGYAILLSAAIFGLSHGNFFQFFYAFLVGLVFGLIYVKTGKLIYTIIYHCIINFLSGVLGVWLESRIDYEQIEKIIASLDAENPTPEQMIPIIEQLLPLALLNCVIVGLAVAGAIIFIKAIKKKKISLESGILPPPKKGRVANVMCTVGTAALVTVYVIFFVISIIPQS